jgi:hypothetical protein
MPRLLLLFILFTTTVTAQFTDRYWAFGDSAGINFKNLANPQPSNSILRVRGTCASICDSAGDLLFYCGTPNWTYWMNGISVARYGNVIDKNHNTMQGGDSLVGLLWYQEMAIVLDPGNFNRFYIFSAGVTTSNHGLYYSIVDLSYNGGLGKVIQKNIQLRNDSITDCVSVVRHGNGRDWWVVVRSWKDVPTKDITAYLVSPSGVFGNPTQYIGPNVANESFYRLKFNLNGDHLYNTASTGVIERYNFDRCIGVFSNRQIYSTPSSIFNNLWDFEISPDESKFYAYSIYQGAFQNLAYLLQFDFNNSNFIASADTLRVFSDPERPGSLKLAPDGKIYSSVFSNVPDGCFDYLYCASTIDTINSNLSVINFPDSLGSSCDFQPYSFYLGGHKAYYGLPNNPNYELDTLHGSPCDTLTAVGLNDLFPSNKELKLYYDKTWQTVFVNAEELQGRKATLEFYNINGQLMERISSETDGSYFSKSSSFSSQADGVYIVRLSTDKEVLTGKFVKW